MRKHTILPNLTISNHLPRMVVHNHPLSPHGGTVDTLDSKSSDFGRVGSNPTAGTGWCDTGVYIRSGVMPKEVIRSVQFIPEDHTHPAHYNQAEVSWNKEGQYVQLGTVTTDPSVEWEDRGQFVQLDRDSINRLIIKLRRARDQVFGKDQ